MEVDENTLTWPEGLRMLLDIIPNAEEAQKLLAFSGDLETLDRPERVLRPSPIEVTESGISTVFNSTS